MKRFLIWCCVVIPMLAAPVSSYGRPPVQEKEVLDARLEGYDKNVTIEGGGSALMWVLMVLLTGITVGTMFKNAKRTHLD